MCNDDWFFRWIVSVLASFTLQSAICFTNGASHSTMWIHRVELNWSRLTRNERATITLRIADLGRVVASVHDRGITLQVEFLSISTALELKLFNCVLFYRTKFVFLSPFYSHSLLDRLNYFLLISQVMLLADVAHQAPVVQKVDSAIHRINRYPVDKY